MNLMDTCDGQKNDNALSSSSYQRRDTASYPRRYRSALGTGHEWADTESVDDETDVNSADLQGFVRSELEALSTGIEFLRDLSSIFTHEESSKLENAAMELSAVPEALMTMPPEGKGETRSFILWKGQGRMAKTQLSQASAGQINCEKVQVNVSRMCTTRSWGW